MKKIKAVMTDNSAFRRSYVICLFLCNVTPVMPLAYAALVGVFLWGGFLLFYNEIRRHTALKTRGGLWLILFLLSAVVTAAVHFSTNLLNDVHNLIMILHAAICFFLLYSVHTEKHLNFRRELYAVCRFIVYATTVLGIIGLACLVANIKFEILGVKFIVYENRFTGLFNNPNQLGFSAAAAIFCSHMLLKKDFIAISGRERVSTIWIASCAAVNAISLLLSDSNGAMVLLLGYAVFYLLYKMVGAERRFSKRQIVTKSISALLAGAVIVGALFFVRNVTQEGFTKVMDSKDTIVVIEGSIDIQNEGITFEHENKNIDSGRFKLWQQATEMFLQNPVLGVGKGNIFDYGRRMFVNGLKFTENATFLTPFLADFHNGYLTILVCSGAVGFLLFAIFGLKFFKHITLRVFREDGLKESTLPCMYAFLCAYSVYAFVEETLLYNIMFTVAFFWLVIGYTSCFLVKYEPDHPLRSIRIFGKRFRRTIL